MIAYKQGNLLAAHAEALVNTVNTVGVMGKGIALMFKEQFPDNMAQYSNACKNKQVQTGKMFITERESLSGPRWIVNFPTKQHWRTPSKMEWIISGLKDLRHFIVDCEVKSIAIPPLGVGNGGLPWQAVREQIERALCDLNDVDIQVYEPINEYQNVPKCNNIKELTPARALIAELIRRYGVLGMECSLLEIQKLAWFLDRSIKIYAPNFSLKLKFKPNYYGPYADSLRHLLNTLDDSYLCCEKRINDARPFDVIWFNDNQNEHLQIYLASDEMKLYEKALEYTSKLIDGFESPFGMELLATIDWLIEQAHCSPNIESLIEGLQNWKVEGPYNPKNSRSAAKRKVRMFNNHAIEVALRRLESMKYQSM